MNQVTNAINACLMIIEGVLGIFNELLIDGQYISLLNMIMFSMIITIILWVIGGMIRHNGNS